MSGKILELYIKNLHLKCCEKEKDQRQSKDYWLALVKQDTYVSAFPCSFATNYNPNISYSFWQCNMPLYVLVTYSFSRKFDKLYTHVQLKQNILNKRWYILLKTKAMYGT